MRTTVHACSQARHLIRAGHQLARRQTPDSTAVRIAGRMRLSEKANRGGGDSFVPSMAAIWTPPAASNMGSLDETRHGFGNDWSPEPGLVQTSKPHSISLSPFSWKCQNALHPDPCVTRTRNRVHVDWLHVLHRVRKGPMFSIIRHGLAEHPLNRPESPYHPAGSDQSLLTILH